MSARSGAWGGAVVRHVLGVLIAMIVVGLVVVWQGNRSATAQAERAAEANVRTIALGLALPLSGDDLSDPDGEWREHIAAIVGPRVDRGEVLAVHLWEPVDASSPRGRVIWSTDQDKVGVVAEPGGGADAWAVGATTVERLDSGSDSQGPDERNLYEIYLGIADRSGRVYVLEVYKPVRQYDAIRSGLLAAWLPVALGGVVVVGLLTLPLSLLLARRAADAERDAARFADRALRARSEERLRIAETLHERSIQDLAAAGLLVDTARMQVDDASLRATLDEVGSLLARDVAELRAVTESEMGSQESGSWSAAITERVAALRLAPITEVAVPDDLRLDDPAVALAHRVVKEALRNTAKHAGASAVGVDATEEGGQLVVSVVDDGRGFDPANAKSAGHVGLEVMRAAVRAGGGTLEVDAAPGVGTTVCVTIPRERAEL